MIFREALRAIPRRARHPLVLGLMAAQIALQVGGALFAAWAQKRAPGSQIPVLPFTAQLVLGVVTGSLYQFLVAPLPWQWTGDGRLMSTSLRSILKALGFAAGFHAVYILCNWNLVEQQKALLSATLPGGRYLLLMAWSYLISIAFQTLIGFALALWETRRTEKAQAERQAEEARWTLLKAQMSPHVLLNSLNGLAELVRDDTAAAVKGMRDLAEIYRQLLSLGEAPQVPLERERQLLERYLAVEQLRLGEGLKVEWAWDPALDVIEAMPLLLQPLVENAIKHGVAADPNGGVIRITGELSRREIRLEVANTGEAPVPTARRGTGVGLRNLKSRLEMAYRGRASFDLVKESPWMRAELILPRENKA